MLRMAFVDAFFYRSWIWILDQSEANVEPKVDLRQRNLVKLVIAACVSPLRMFVCVLIRKFDTHRETRNLINFVKRISITH